MLRIRKCSKVLTLSLTITMCLLVVLGSVGIEATSGRLKGASIVSCGGVNYGSHGDGHWHVATDNGSKGWYSNGAPVGSTNPCSGSPAPSTPKAPAPSAPKAPAEKPKAPVVTESNEEKEKREQAAKEAELKKAEEAAAKEAKRKEQERLAEEQRVKEEKEEAERVRLQNIKLNDTSIDKIHFGDETELQLGEVVLLDYSKEIEPIIKTSNESASYKTSTKNGRSVFMLNDLLVDVVSENGESTNLFTYSFFDLGSNKELLDQEVELTYSMKNKDYKVKLSDSEEGKVFDLGTLSDSEARDIRVISLNINGQEVEFDSNEKVFNSKSDPFDQESSFDFGLSNLEYSIPLKINKKSNTPLVMASVGAGSAIGLFALLKRKK